MMEMSKTTRFEPYVARTFSKIAKEIYERQNMEILLRAYEKALKEIAANICCDKCQEAALVARAALREKNDG
jgi:formylmethanofuran dehydrogenase subunit E